MDFESVGGPKMVPYVKTKSFLLNDTFLSTVCKLVSTIGHLDNYTQPVHLKKKKKLENCKKCNILNNNCDLLISRLIPV